MKIHISPNNGVPIYMQIVNQVKHLFASSRLVAGDELPPIRVLAEQLIINPNTVARAYRELQTEGILIKRQGAGTYVSDQGSPLAHKERIRILNEKIDGLLAEAMQLDVGVDKIIELIHKRKQVLESDNRRK